MMNFVFLESLVSALVRSGSQTTSPGQGIYFMFMSLGVIFELIFMLVIFLIWAGMIALMIAFVVICILSYWKIFTKAGKPGYAAIIPVYNTYILAEMCFGNGIYCLIILVGFLPGIGSLALTAYMVYQAYQLGRVFNKGVGFTIGLILCPIVFLPMLALGKDEYDPDKVSFLF